jgi:hypothetical protein
MERPHRDIVSSPVAPANDERMLQNGRENNHTISVVKQVIGAVVGNIENLFEHRAAVL